MYALPGTTIHPTLEDAATGLVGTLGVRVQNTDATNQIPRTTAGIVEILAGSGTYTATLTAPTTVGEYVVLWDDGSGNYASEELFVTYTLPASVPSTPNILSRAEYKTLRSISGTTQDPAIDLALGIADDVIVRYTDRDFTTVPASATKTYRIYGGGIVEIDDAEAITQVQLNNFGGTGGYVLTSGTQYVPGAYNEPVFSWIDLGTWLQTSGANYSAGQMGFMQNLDTLFEFGSGGYFPTVNVTATFGWPQNAIPPTAKQASAWLVDEFIKDDSGDLQSESIVDLSKVWATAQSAQASSLPKRITDLLDTLRRPAI